MRFSSRQQQKETVVVHFSFHGHNPFNLLTFILYFVFSELLQVGKHGKFISDLEKNFFLYL